MGGVIRLTARQRTTLSEWRRKSPNRSLQLPAHIMLLLDQGLSWRETQKVLFLSTATIALWKTRFEQEGVEGLFGKRRGRPCLFCTLWMTVVAWWAQRRKPKDFQLTRSRWSCQALGYVLQVRYRLKASSETVRRWLHQQGLVWRRPRPVVARSDPEHDLKLEKIRQVLKNLGPDETAVFQDEVDLNLNPKVGAMWMPRGRRAQVLTPGNNQKRYLAGSLHWRTGTLLVSEPGTVRNAELFIRHLDHLRRTLCRYRVIHVICDNA